MKQSNLWPDNTTSSLDYIVWLRTILSFNKMFISLKTKGGKEKLPKTLPELKNSTKVSNSVYPTWGIL